MRVLFAGTPRFALPSLEGVAASERHELVGVLTRPDRPKGRGRSLLPSPIKEKGLALGLPVLQPTRPSGPESIAGIERLKVDVVAVVAYGRILKRAFLNLPPAGCVNVHASLLPAYRGASPIESAILDGIPETGVTTMMIDEGLDTGDILLRETTPVGESETAGELAERLSLIGGRLLVETLDRLEDGNCPRRPQDSSLATNTSPIRRNEARIRWSHPAERIVRLVRAMNPRPVAFTETKRGLLRVYRATPEVGFGPPGTVLSADPKKGLVVAASDGAVRLCEIQLPGKRRMEDRALLSGASFPTGLPLTGGG